MFHSSHCGVSPRAPPPSQSLGPHNCTSAVAGAALLADGRGLRGLAVARRRPARIRGTALLAGKPSRDGQIWSHPDSRTTTHPSMSWLVGHASRSEGPPGAARSRTMGPSARRKISQAIRNHDASAACSSTCSNINSRGSMTSGRSCRADKRPTFVHRRTVAWMHLASGTATDGNRLHGCVRSADRNSADRTTPGVPASQGRLA